MANIPQPAIYISHGGGPCFWMDMPAPIGAHGFDKLRHYLAGLIETLPARPRAVLVITAHWEETIATVNAAAEPSMLFDYYGFPLHTYQLVYPAKGSPELALEAQNLLKTAGITCNLDAARGFDHGVFVPFLIIDPEAKIPVVTMSLQKNLDPAQHIAIGKALAPLRRDNILIVGSGSSYHNLSEFFNGQEHPSQEFDHWLNDAVTNQSAAERNNRLENWSQAPHAKDCHPRAEHLLPLMVVSGAGENESGKRSFQDSIGGKAISCFSFG
jgi:aromatic ring-opening dioxygenase catalytic subunit (LigB family)